MIRHAFKMLRRVIFNLIINLESARFLKFGVWSIRHQRVKISSLPEGWNIDKLTEQNEQNKQKKL